MKSLIILFSIFLSCLSLDLNSAEIFLDGVINSQLSEHDIGAATLSIVYEGQLLLKKGFGKQDLHTLTSPDLSLFRPGSVSKLFTWSAIMKLYEIGLIDLDEDINNYLDFSIPNDSLWSQEHGTITLRHILLHRSGFEDQSDHLFVLSADRLISLEKYCKEFLPERVFATNEASAYSNYATALAGYIVERVTKKSFNDYLQETFFSPLSMSMSTFEQPLSGKLLPFMTQVYRKLGNEWVQAPFELIPGSPAGALTTTALDMSKFMLMHLNNGTFNNIRIFKPETIELMHEHHFSASQFMSGMAFGFMEDSINGHRVLKHGGNTMNFHSGLYLVKSLNLGFLFHLTVGLEMSTTSFDDEQLRKCDAKISKKFSGQYHPLRSSFSTEAKIVALFMRVSVSVDKSGCLVMLGNSYVHHPKDSNLFVNRFSNVSVSFERIYFSTSTNGHSLLSIEMPMDYIRVSFLQSSAVLLLILVLNTGFFLLTPIVWFINRKRHNASESLDVSLMLDNHF
ncbi:hypothetical protein GEMRC1_002264 [Eukaryota sp. GEM-RC1]